MQRLVRIDDHQPFDPVLVQQAARFLAARALADGDDIARHQRRDRLIHVFGKSHIAIGDNADDAGVLIHDGIAGKPRPLFQVNKFGERGLGRDGGRIDDDAALEFLHLTHLPGLLVRRHVPVQHAQTAGLRHGNGQPRFGHRIHGGGRQRNVERNRVCQAAANIDLGWHDLGRAGLQKHIVEGESGADLHRAGILFGPLKECAARGKMGGLTCG